MKCVRCGNEIKPFSSKSRYCSSECARKANIAKTKALQAKKRGEQATKQAVAVFTRKPVEGKSFADWCREANECGMDYGNYRAQIEVFGKTFEELKANGQSTYYCGSHIHQRTR